MGNSIQPYSEVVARLLASTVQTGGTASPLRRATEELVRLAGRENGDLKNGFRNLSLPAQKILRARFGESLDPLLEISSSRKPRQFYRQLLNLGHEAMQEGDTVLAGAIFQGLATEGISENVPDEIQRKAQGKLSVLAGEGSFTDQFEFQAPRIIREGISLPTAFGFGVGIWVSARMRLATLNFLRPLAASSFLARGYGAGLTASTFSLAAEIPAVYGAQHLAHRMLHPEMPLGDFSAAKGEMATLGRMLLAARLGMGVSRGLFNKIHGIHPMSNAVARGHALTRISQPALQQLGLVSGLYGFHGYEVFSKDRFFDFHHLSSKVFWDWGYFTVGALGARAVLGPGYFQRLRELEIKTIEATRRIHSQGTGTEAGPSWFRRWFQPWLVTPEGFRMSSSDVPSWQPSWRDQIARSSVLGKIPLRRIDLPTALEKPSTIVELIPRMTPAQVQRLAKKFLEHGKLAHFALALEKGQVGTTDLRVAQASEKLKNLELEFFEFVDQRRRGISHAERKDIFQAWQNDLNVFAEGTAGFPTRAAAFGIASKHRWHHIHLKGLVQKRESLSEYYYDLFLVREFLRSKGINRFTEDNGRLVSELILGHPGNCVSLSLLFGHFASLLERPLRVGLGPNHLYLVPKELGVIESTLDYGMSNFYAYKKHAIPAEKTPLPPQAILGFHLLNLGKLKAREGQHVGAKEIFEISQHILPENPRPLFHLGQLSVKTMDYGSAGKLFGRYADLHPTPYNQLRAKAWQALGEQNYSAAETHFREMNRIDSSDLDVYWGLEYLYRQTGRMGEAARMREILEF